MNYVEFKHKQKCERENTIINFMFFVTTVALFLVAM